MKAGLIRFNGIGMWTFCWTRHDFYWTIWVCWTLSLLNKMSLLNN